MKAVIVLLLPLILASYSDGYYWVEWDGSVPQFAVKAGRDNRGVSYIAQAYIPNAGIYIGQIFPGQEEIFLNTEIIESGVAVNISSYEIKVLCSKQANLDWMATNFTRTQEIIEKGDVHLIRGGVDDRNGPVYIGKYSDGINVYIGSVHYTYFVFYSTADGLSKYTYAYELLVSEKGTDNY